MQSAPKRKYVVKRDKSRPGLYARDGWWNVAIYPTGKGGGKPYRKALSTQDHALAAEWYDQHAGKIRQDFERGALGLKVERYWQEAVAIYVSESKRTDWGPDGERLKWINAKLNGLKLSGITYDLWKRITDQKIADTIAKRGKCSGATPNRLTALVNAVMNAVAVAPHKWIAYEAKRFYLYPEAEPREVTISVELAQARVGRLPEWVQDLFLYALATGARRRNVIGLQREWLKLAERAIDIPARSFKQRKPHRQALNGMALEIIRRQPGIGPRDAAWEGPQEIFLRDGAPITKDMLRHAWDASKRPEDAHIQWRDLRRTWATWMREANVSLDDTQLLGGWRSKEMLVRVYSKPSTGFLVDKAGALDGLLTEISNAHGPHEKSRAG